MLQTTTALPSFFVKTTSRIQMLLIWIPEFFCAPSLMRRFLMEADLPAMLKIAKWFNVFWHPRIYLHSHLPFSLITSTCNPNLLLTHFVRLTSHWSPNSKANSDDKHLLLRLCGSLAPSNMLTNGMSDGVICYCCWRITIHQTGYWIYIFWASCMTKLSPKSTSEINIGRSIEYFSGPKASEL